MKEISTLYYEKLFPNLPLSDFLYSLKPGNFEIDSEKTIILNNEKKLQNLEDLKDLRIINITGELLYKDNEY